VSERPRAHDYVAGPSTGHPRDCGLRPSAVEDAERILDKCDEDPRVGRKHYGDAAREPAWGLSTSRTPGFVYGALGACSLDGSKGLDTYTTE
jgi:hypothetical protein